MTQARGGMRIFYSDQERTEAILRQTARAVRESMALLKQTEKLVERSTAANESEKTAGGGH